MANKQSRYKNNLSIEAVIFRLFTSFEKKIEDKVTGLENDIKGNTAELASMLTKLEIINLKLGWKNTVLQISAYGIVVGMTVFALWAAGVITIGFSLAQH